MKPNYLSKINHLNYAITWFMLAITLSFILVFLSGKNNMSKSSKFIISYLSGFLVFTIITQIILGAWVRLTGSGMSCPDWPLCYGFFFPTYNKITQLGVIEYTYFQIFLEWIHRANAAFIIGPLTINIIFYIVLNKVIESFSKLLILFNNAVGIQGLLGGLTVMKSNIPWSVALHLASAFLLLFIVLNIFLLALSNKILNF